MVPHSSSTLQGTRTVGRSSIGEETTRRALAAHGRTCRLLRASSISMGERWLPSLLHSPEKGGVSSEQEGYCFQAPKKQRKDIVSKSIFSVVLYGAQSLPRRAYECCTVCNAMRTRASERTNGDRRRGFMFISRRNAEKYSTVKAPSINYSGRNIRFPSNISCLVYIRRSAHCGV
jgi:hypothetical protein